MLGGCRMVREAKALGNARDTGSPMIPADADPVWSRVRGVNSSLIAMADAEACSATHTEAWRDKPWKKFQRTVFRLQKRIYRASQRQGRSQDALIDRLNPIIRGWSRYYRHVGSARDLARMDSVLWYQLCSWARWRHRGKGRAWRAKRYWHRSGTRRVFAGRAELAFHSDTTYARHTKVQGRRSPFDGDWSYWGHRLRRYAGLPAGKGALLGRQQGKCAHCGLYLMASDRMEVHHLDGNRKNNAGSNRVLVHLPCHDQVHGIRDKDAQTEEPDDSRESRPVLERQGAGRPAS